MVFYLLLLLIATVIIITWNVGVPFSAKLRATKDGFIFRTKYPTDYRLEDRQEEIDAIATRLQNTETHDSHTNSEES